jgi:hypothetical protein
MAAGEVGMCALAMTIFGMISIGPAVAQTYAPGYPFCLRSRGTYECSSRH